MEPRTSQGNDGIEGRYDDGEQQPNKPPEECMDKFSFSENEVTYTRKVFTTIVGSSVLETAARTSGYGESLMKQSRQKICGARWRGRHTHSSCSSFGEKAFELCMCQGDIWDSVSVVTSVTTSIWVAVIDRRFSCTSPIEMDLVDRKSQLGSLKWSTSSSSTSSGTSGTECR